MATLAKLGLLLLLTLTGQLAFAAGAPANDNFAAAQAISGNYGTAAGDTTGATPELGEPTHVGISKQFSVWYQWTAPLTGEVSFDTLNTPRANDTLLAVYQGSSVGRLTQIAANDDIYPRQQFNQSVQYTFIVDPLSQSNLASGAYSNSFGTYVLTQIPVAGQITYSNGAVSGPRSYYLSATPTAYTLPNAGPSGLRFNCKAGTTYYIAVASKGAAGPFNLNWAYQPSGVFRFATEDMDLSKGGSGSLMYRCAEGETVQVTVTRVGGAVGRATVDYQTVPGVPAAIINGDRAALAGTDFLVVTGRLIFDNFEMSKTISIPTIRTGVDRNRSFTVALTNAQLDALESSDVAPPQVDASFGQAMVRIMDKDIDPRALGITPILSTNGSGTNAFTYTNQVYGIAPVANSAINFEQAHYRVSRLVAASNFSVFISRNGGSGSNAVTVRYRVNGVGGNSLPHDNDIFPLQPGSDYATPIPPTIRGIHGDVSDFSCDSGDAGTLTWAANDFGNKSLTFTILQNNLVQFNEDFQIELVDTNGAYPGMVAETFVTILFDEFNPPAGSVDQFHNTDLGLSFSPVVNTVPPNMTHPGTDGEVYGVALQGDGKSIVVGDFFTYDLAGRNCIARVKTDGLLDTTFNPGSGANNFITSVAVTDTNQVVVAGAFTSFNGTQRNGVARLNSNGSLDTTFNPGLGADGTIWALKLQTDGKVLIGGDFTSFNGVPRKNVARLNADGSLDTSFDPGNILNGPVYSLSIQGNSFISIDRTATGTDLEDRQNINLGGTSGVLTIDYDFQSVPDEMHIYYGTNRIYNSGYTNGIAHIVVPVGPINGFSTNVVTIIMNEGGGTLGTAWSYTGTLQLASSTQVAVGGDFTSVGGVVGQDRVARLLNDGSVDSTFSLGSGIDGVVYALDTQSDGKLIVGGEFKQVNGVQQNRLTRLNSNGSLDESFFAGTGVDGTVYNVGFQTNGNIYVGGAFTSINGTHRLGFARLNSDGTVDTSFMDTAYNQFAGLPRPYFSDPLGKVFSSAVQANGDVIIGGSFTQVGGGQLNGAIRQASVGLNVVSLQSSRDGVRNRNNVARLIGGQTPGPGNVGLIYDNYSVNRSEGQLYLSLIRTNGNLGPATVNLSVQPALALSGQDFQYYSHNPLYWLSWAGSRMHSDGLFGDNNYMESYYSSPWIDTEAQAVVTILSNTNVSGDLSSQVQLANPKGQDSFFLGGANIPLGVALGAPAAPLTIIDDRHASGNVGFAKNTYTANSALSPVSLLRTNGSYGVISLKYATITNGSTAVLNTDYKAASGTVTFTAGQISNYFNVQVLQSNYISSVEKVINMQLSNLQTPSNGVAALGLTNAVLRIINANFEGYLNLATNAYSTNLNAGSVTVTVTRTVGSKGTATLQYRTVNGTAVSGADYVGATNLLTWDSGDVSPRTITIPFINSGTIGGNKQFSLQLFAPQLNGTNAPSILGATSNAIVTIVNDNNYGAFQFINATNVVNEKGDFATLTVIRTGSALGSATVNYNTANGPAVSGVNYTTTSGTLSFAPGQLAASFPVKILDDNVVNPPPAGFFFRVILSSPSLGSSLGSPVTNIVSIVDDESYNRIPGAPDSSFNTSGGMNGDVLALARQSNGQIVAGGNFTAVNGYPENHIARLNPDGSLDALGFQNGLNGANGAVYSLVNQTDDRILVGGAFTTMNGIVRNRITRLMVDGNVDSSFNPGAGADGTIYTLAETFVNGARKIYAGGTFNAINSTPSSGLARLNNDGTVDNTFSIGTGPNGPIYSLAAYPTNSILAGKVVVAGAFTSINNQAATNIAVLNADGSLDAAFTATASTVGTVRAVALQIDGKVLIGGEFTNVNGIAISRMARLNTNGTLDASFTSNIADGANGTVNAIAVQADNRIILTGEFAEANGVTRHGITRLMADGTVDPTINFGSGANGAVNAVIIQPEDAMLVIGGGFTQFSSQPHAYIARIYGGSMTGSGSFEFTSAAFQVDENGVQAQITIRRVGGTSGTNPNGTGSVFVNFATSDGTAASGVNYGNLNFNVEFPAGEVLKTVLLPVFNDQVITPDLTVNLTLSSPTVPAGIGDQAKAVLTIFNVNSAVTFSAANYSVAKNVLSGVAVIDVLRTGSAIGSASVDFLTTNNGTALDGVDYSATNITVTFAAGEVQKSVEVAIANNGLLQGNRTIGLQLANALNTSLSSPSNAVLTIIDTVTSPGELSFATNLFFAAETDANAVLTLLRTNGSAGIVSVNYTTIANTAQPGANYSTTSGTLTFGAGVTSRTLNIPLLNNNLVQGPVNFTVQLSAPAGGAILSSPTNAIVIVSDDDIGLAFSSATNFVVETAGFATVNVLRQNGTTGVTTVNYSTTNGTATAGTHYTPFSGTLTFNNGESLKTISVPIADLPQVQGDLSFVIGLYNPGSGAQIGVPGATTVVIQDSDAGLSFTNAAMSVQKNGTNAVITVVCSNPRVEPVVFTPFDVPLSVHYATVSGTAIAGQDFVNTSGTLVFTNGIATNTFVVPIISNNLVSGDRTFTVALSNPTFPGQLLSPSNQVVTIVDNNTGFKFSNSGYTVLESNVLTTITVLRTGNPNTMATVNYSTTNGTATAGVNYLPASGTLVFSNGVTSQNFTVFVIDDTVIHPDLTVLLQLSNPSNAVLVAPSAATLTIHDVSGSLVEPAGVALLSESIVPANGIIQPGETVTMLFGLKATAGTNVNNLTATLQSGGGVTVPSGPTNYGSLIVGGAAVARAFTFTAASGSNGQPVAATFQLQDGPNNLGTVVFTFKLGTYATTFFSPAAIVINDHTNASPYPATIDVSGVGGALYKATVTFRNITHTSPSDIDALLVSPSDQAALIMAHCGGHNTITNATLTFDDAAASYLSNTAPIVPGTNKPTAYFPVPLFPAGSLSTPPAAPYATNLAVFNGSNPNGTWALFVQDDTFLDSGVISNGWSLKLTTANVVGYQPPQLTANLVGNSFQLSVSSPFVSTIIQSSTNLINWTSITTNTPPFNYNVTVPAGNPNRFFRGVLNF